MKGKGPRGQMRGDSEQWIFPSVVLEDWEKRELVARVIEIATLNMFNKHFYKFGGKSYHQSKGGPIGLRGTCAVARLVMQVFDGKWKLRLQGWGIEPRLLGR